MLNLLPSTSEMYNAIVERNSAYDGVFFTAVRTTGIFCRPTCSARKPRPENVEFYPSVREALAAGYRPCKRCRPMTPNGRAPEWLKQLLEEVDGDSSRRWKDADLRNMSIDPVRVRRWFLAHYGMTFHAYQRARRLGMAMGQIRHGADLTHTAYDHGFESLSGFRDAFAKLFGETPGRSRASTCVMMTRVLTPLGPMVAGATDEGLCLLEFTDRRMLETQIKRLRKWLDCSIAPGDNPHITQIDDELTRYFEGTLREFTVPLVAPGTAFQRSVWESLRKVPYGNTGTYEAIARDIGKPGAQRAVGKANGDNRLAIIIPCHRIVRSDGQLWGYGGGIWRKRYLIDHERKHLEG